MESSCLVKAIILAAVGILLYAVPKFAGSTISQIREAQIAQGNQLACEGKVSEQFAFAGNFYEYEVEDGRYRVGTVKKVLYKDKYNAVEIRIQDMTNGRFWIVVGTTLLWNHVFQGDDVVIADKKMGIISLHQQ
jgi:hypothetical protein